jgi:hypothetical protein
MDLFWQVKFFFVCNSLIKIIDHKSYWYYWIYYFHKTIFKSIVAALGFTNSKYILQVLLMLAYILLYYTFLLVSSEYSNMYDFFYSFCISRYAKLYYVICLFFRLWSSFLGLRLCCVLGVHCNQNEIFLKSRLYYNCKHGFFQVMVRFQFAVVSAPV